MKKILSLCCLLLFCVSATRADGAEYVFDKLGQHVFITFKASHLGYSYILGHFEDFNGSFVYDPQKPEDSSVHVTVDVRSLDTDHAERDKHLRGSGYFDVETYPSITFASSSYAGSSTSGVLTGNLNLRGVSKTIAIDVSKIGEGDDPWGGYRSGFEGSVILDAGDYGLPAWIGDVEVYLVVEGVRQ
jgi:polyisoprenoid-binding protein YceI